MIADNIRVLTSKTGYVVAGFRFLKRWPFIPVLIIILASVTAIFAPLIAPNHPLEAEFGSRNIAPSWSDETSTYLLGGDHIGRDVLSRVIFGSRISLTVAATVLLAGGTIGTAVGIAAGYAGGATDEVLMRLVDFTFALPYLLVAMVATVVFGPSMKLIIILLIFLSWAPFARQVRAETLRLKTLDYVALAKVSGASAWRIARRHLLPGVINTVMVLASLRVGALIIAESTLSYLGVGIPAPTPSWGGMTAEGRNYISTAWWISFFPGLAIVLVVFAFNFLGDWLRDWFDPRLRQL